MRTSSVSGVGRQLSVGLVLVTFVSLVTFMFSFLGTILCAALFGMMVGFGRKWKWHIVLISLLFPALLLVSLHASRSKSELSWLENFRLASVCFGTFWATYLATRGVFLLEGRDQVTSRDPAAPAAGTPVQRPEAALRELDLEQLQGAWSQEITLPAGQPARRVIQVERNELTMVLVRNDGETQLLARGELQLVKHAPS